MLPYCIERPFCATQAVHLGNRIVLVGTIQAPIFRRHGRGDPAKLRGEMIGYRFAAGMSTINAWNRHAITRRTEVGKYQPKARPVSQTA